MCLVHVLNTMHISFLQNMYTYVYIILYLMYLFHPRTQYPRNTHTQYPHTIPTHNIHTISTEQLQSSAQWPPSERPPSSAGGVPGAAATVSLHPSARQMLLENAALAQHCAVVQGLLLGADEVRGVCSWVVYWE